MKPSALALLTLATILIGCAATQETRLVLQDSSTGDRFVGAVVSGANASMTAAIEINGVSYIGKFISSDSSTAALLVGTGSDLLHCNLHFNAKARTGAGKCVQSGSHRFDVTLSQG